MALGAVGEHKCALFVTVFMPYRNGTRLALLEQRSLTPLDDISHYTRPRNTILLLQLQIVVFLSCFGSQLEN